MGAVLSALILGERLSATRVVGIVIILSVCACSARKRSRPSARTARAAIFCLSAPAHYGRFQRRLAALVGQRHARFGVVSVLSVLIVAPLHGLFFGYQSMIAAGLTENLIQAFVQGLLGGAFPIYLYARSVSILGSGRASMFIALVPVFSVILGIPRHWRNSDGDAARGIGDCGAGIPVRAQP